MYAIPEEDAEGQNATKPTVPAALNPLPAEGVIRLRQILGDPKANPPLPPIVPVCRATWYEGMKTGRFPRPIRIGARVMAYRVEDIRKLIEAEPDDEDAELRSTRAREAGRRSAAARRRNGERSAAPTQEIADRGTAPSQEGYPMLTNSNAPAVATARGASGAPSSGVSDCTARAEREASC